MLYNLILIGVGGTGSHLAPLFSRYFSYNQMLCKFTLIDADKLEEKNLSRQNFGSIESIDDYKVHKIELPLIETGLVKRVKDYVYNLSRFLSSSKFNIVISCVDNNYSRAKQLQSCIDSGHDFYFLSPGNNQTRGQLIGYGREKEVFIGTSPFDIYESWRNPDSSQRPTVSCTQMVESAPQSMLANIMASTATFNAVVGLVERDEYVTSGMFDSETYSITVGEVIKRH